VVYLKRIAQGPLVLGDLKKGKWRALSDGEVASLKKEQA
jgi:16S rRNA U516 pseudouridylate synthase RsuA-like enzyme